MTKPYSIRKSILGKPIIKRWYVETQFDPVEEKLHDWLYEVEEDKRSQDPYTMSWHYEHSLIIINYLKLKLKRIKND